MHIYQRRMAALAAAVFLGMAGAAAQPVDSARPVWRSWSQKLSSPPELPSQGVRSGDFLAMLGANHLLPMRNIGIQCQGANATLLDVPDRRVYAPGVQGMNQQRFGEVEWNGTRALMLQLNGHDVVREGQSPRCEVVFYPLRASALPDSGVFWYSVSFWVNDWTGSSDEQIISQMKGDDSSRIALNPFFALVVKGNKIRTEVRWNPDDPPSKQGTQLFRYAEHLLPMQRWVNITVKGRLDAAGSEQPFLTVWLDDRVIAEHRGPLGYKNPGNHLNYVKSGIYHWVDNNPWDMSVPDRYMLLGAMAAVSDPMGRYNLADIRQVMSALMQ